MSLNFYSVKAYIECQGYSLIFLADKTRTYTRYKNRTEISTS